MLLLFLFLQNFKGGTNVWVQKQKAKEKVMNRKKTR